MALWSLTAQDWSAIAGLGTMLVAVAAGLVALGQLRESRRLRAEQTQPYVVAYLAASPASSVVYDLVVKNFGLTVARDVSVRISPEPRRALDQGDGDPIAVPVFPVLVPGQEWRTLWDTTIARADSGLPDVYEVSLWFTDSHSRERFSFTFVIDWCVVRRSYVDEYGLHEIGKSLKEISKTIGGWKESTGRGLAVIARDGDSRDRARLEAYEERQRQSSEAAVEEGSSASDDVE